MTGGCPIHVGAALDELRRFSVTLSAMAAAGCAQLLVGPFQVGIFWDSGRILLLQGEGGAEHSEEVMSGLQELGIAGCGWEWRQGQSCGEAAACM